MYVCKYVFTYIYTSKRVYIAVKYTYTYIRIDCAQHVAMLVDFVTHTYIYTNIQICIQDMYVCILFYIVYLFSYTKTYMSTSLQIELYL